VVPITDIIEQADLTAASGWSVSGAMEISTRMNSRNAIRWAKRAIHMPIGERWLVISVFAIIGGAAWALGVLLALGVVALAYVTAGRVLRSLSWHGSSPTDAWVLLWRQADAGPVLSGVGRLISINGIWAAPFGWAVPALLRLVELGLVAVLAIWLFPSATTIAFWWVAVIAFHHYDVLYRAIQGRPTPRWITWAGLGWDGRTIVVIVVAILGLAAFTTVLGWGALVLAIILVAIASVQWLRSGQ
jgi:hypothetical protein